MIVFWEGPCYANSSLTQRVGHIWNQPTVNLMLPLIVAHHTTLTTQFFFSCLETTVCTDKKVCLTFILRKMLQQHGFSVSKGCVEVTPSATSSEHTQPRPKPSHKSKLLASREWGQQQCWWFAHQVHCRKTDARDDEILLILMMRPYWVLPLQLAANSPYDKESLGFSLSVIYFSSFLFVGGGVRHTRLQFEYRQWTMSIPRVMWSIQGLSKFLSLSAVIF